MAEQLGDIASYNTHCQCPRCGEIYGVRVTANVKRRMLLSDDHKLTDEYTVISELKIEPRAIDDQERMEKLKADAEVERREITEADKKFEQKHAKKSKKQGGSD